MWCPLLRRRSAPTEAGHGSVSPATAPNSGGHDDFGAEAPRANAEFGRTSRAAAGVGSGRAASFMAVRPGRADDDGSGRGGSAVRCRQTRRFAGTGTRPRPVHEFGGEAAGVRIAGQGAVERSPVPWLRHLAALNGFGAFVRAPRSSRYIPVAVRSDVSTSATSGCCSYVDPRQPAGAAVPAIGLETPVPSVVPFALGGATELSNLRVRCRAHHRLRHAPRHDPPGERVPTLRSPERTVKSSCSRAVAPVRDLRPSWRPVTPRMIAPPLQFASPSQSQPRYDAPMLSAYRFTRSHPRRQGSKERLRFATSALPSRYGGATLERMGCCSTRPARGRRLR